MNKNVITKEGYQLIKKRLSDLEKQSKLIADRLTYARLDGDLSENADWIVLRENLENTHDKINRIRKILENSDVVERNENSEKIVQVGSVVNYLIIDNSGTSTNKELEIEITSEMDSDPFVGKVSYLSPLGSSLINKEVGEEVEVNNSNVLKRYKIRILKIR
ncbi:MAG: Transcription elongation factor GreA [Mycoplasmataceae bacterium]|nr:MAG: Transcription elongation factor GreA [Mycoplasmataceae bacterium]